MNNIQGPGDAVQQQPRAKFWVLVGKALVYLGFLGALAGGAIFLIGFTADPTAEPVCDTTVAKPSESCILPGGRSPEGRPYAESVSLLDGDSRKMLSGIGVSAAGMAVVVGGAVVNNRYGGSGRE